MLPLTTQPPGALGNLAYELAGFTAVVGLCLIYVLLLYLTELRRPRFPHRW